MKRKSTKLKQKPLKYLLILLALALTLPLALIHAEDEPYEFVEPALYDETAENGIADPEAARALFAGLAPEITLEDLDEEYGTSSLIATFTNNTSYPLQGYSFWGILRSNDEELYGEFSDYIVMPGESQRIVLMYSIYVDEEEFVLESQDDFELQTMTANFFDSSGHVASVQYDALKDEVIDVESYPSIPLSTEPLMNIEDIGIGFIDAGDSWIEYFFENNTQKPILSIAMFYQDAYDYIVRLQHFETILPGEKSPDLFLNYDGPVPNTELLKPRSLEVTFYIEGRDTTVRYDYGPAMYRSIDPELARTGVWEPEEELEGEKPEIVIPEPFVFPDNVVAIENELQDMPLVITILETLEPEFSTQVINEEAGVEAITVTYTNTSPYPIQNIDFSGKIISTNKPLWLYYEDHILMPGDTHSSLVWRILDSGESEMESNDDFELSEVSVTFLDGPSHTTYLTYDVKLKRLELAQGFEYFEWTEDVLMDIDLFDYEFIDQGDGQATYVLQNNSDQTVSYIEMFVKTPENYLLQLQSYTMLQPGETSEETWLYASGIHIDPSNLEPLSLMVVFSEEDREVPVIYDYSLDMYQMQIFEE